MTSYNDVKRSDCHETLTESSSYYFLTTVKISIHLDKFKEFYGSLCDLGLTIGIRIFSPTATDKNAVTFFLRMILTQNFQGKCETK